MYILHSEPSNIFANRVQKISKTADFLLTNQKSVHIKNNMCYFFEIHIFMCGTTMCKNFVSQIEFKMKVPKIPGCNLSISSLRVKFKL